MEMDHRIDMASEMEMGTDIDMDIDVNPETRHGHDNDFLEIGRTLLRRRISALC